MHLNDGRFFDLLIQGVWGLWMQNFLQYGGVMLNDGWIPREQIKGIVPVLPESAPSLPDNVVSLFKRQP